MLFGEKKQSTLRMTSCASVLKNTVVSGTVLLRLGGHAVVLGTKQQTRAENVCCRSIHAALRSFSSVYFRARTNVRGERCTLDVFGPSTARSQQTTDEVLRPYPRGKIGPPIQKNGGVLVLEKNVVTLSSLDS